MFEPEGREPYRIVECSSPSRLCSLSISAWPQSGRTQVALISEVISGVQNKRVTLTNSSQNSCSGLSESETSALPWLLDGIASRGWRTREGSASIHDQGNRPALCCVVLVLTLVSNSFKDKSVEQTGHHMRMMQYRLEVF